MSKIEEILKNAGIEDQAAIDAVKAEMPKAFIPLEDHNARMAKAKNETADVQKAFDAFKEETEKAAGEAAKQGGENEKAVEELQKKLADLEGKYTASQDAIKQRDAREALSKALKGAGANPAALELLADKALASVEYGDDGKASNVEAAVEALKKDNAGLFGEPVNTSKPQEKGEKGGGEDDPFLRGLQGKN